MTKTTKNDALVVRVKKLDAAAKLPERKTDGAAGYDISALSTTIVRPINAEDKATAIRTGLSFEIPEGYHMKVFLRSSIGLNTKIRLSNQTGIIDSDYRGELMLLVENLGRERVFIAEGQRIAQLMIEKNVDISFVEAKGNLTDTKRGSKGLGSTTNEVKRADK